VSAYEVAVDLPFLLGIVVAAEECDARRGIPGHDGTCAELIEAQTARLGTDVGMENEFELRS
jgi:hypothetical protein